MYRALIIDDEKPVRTAITALGHWNRWKIAVPDYAANGKEGLQVLRSRQYHIVFVDMNMPVMSGIHFLELASGEFPRIQYIVISGYDDFYYAQTAIKAGAIDYLLKPVEERDLEAALKKAVSTLIAQGGESADAFRESMLPPDQAALSLKEYLEAHYAEKITLTALSKRFFFSREYLCKVFKKKYGIGIYEYTTRVRMEKARDMLIDSGLQIQEISEQLGFSDNNYFSKTFRNYYRVSPSEFREKNGSGDRRKKPDCGIGD